MHFLNCVVYAKLPEEVTKAQGDQLLPRVTQTVDSRAGKRRQTVGSNSVLLACCLLAQKDRVERVGLWSKAMCKDSPVFGEGQGKAVLQQS